LVRLRLGNDWFSLCLSHYYPCCVSGFEISLLSNFLVSYSMAIPPFVDGPFGGNGLAAKKEEYDGVALFLF